MERDLLEAALRVLNACVFGDPAAEDVAKLRDSASATERDLAPDALATRIIGREVERSRARRRGAAK